MLLVSISIITLITFGIMVKALCRYRKKYHEYRDLAGDVSPHVAYVLSCYGDPYIVEFKEIIEHPKVSIILPVYNKGWCVEAALRSLQRQTLQEIEIICVDDGSTDDSVEKIKNYQRHDTRIKLVENGENRGTLYTRAHGIREAIGDYIMFLDPDDLYATNDIVEVAYNKCIELNVDVVCFGGYVAREDSLRENKFCHDIEFSKIYDDRDKFFTNVDRYCWNKCTRRRCLIQALNGCDKDVLNKHINHAEDWFFSCAVSPCIESCMCLLQLGYFYNLNAQSLSKQPGVVFLRSIKHANDILNVHNAILASFPYMQNFLIRHFSYWIQNHDILGPYADDQLQQLYDIYMQINFDDEHKAKLSQYLQDGIAEMRKLRDSAPKE